LEASLITDLGLENDFLSSPEEEDELDTTLRPVLCDGAAGAEDGRGCFHTFRHREKSEDAFSMNREDLSVSAFSSRVTVGIISLAPGNTTPAKFFFSRMNVILKRNKPSSLKEGKPCAGLPNYC